MGTGKSAVGEILSKQLKRPFVDMDERIEKGANCSIPEIFAEKGESVFRQMESKAVREIVKEQGVVVAAGGGVMLDEQNVRLLKESGTLICLSARPEVILERTLANLPSRPLLQGDSPLGRVEELLELRAPFYAKADLTLDTSDRSIEEVVEEILKTLKSEK